MYDSYGDGWNNATLTINGTDYSIYSDDGVGELACVNLEVCNTFSWTSGVFDSETSWQLLNEYLELITEGSAGSVPDGIGHCEGCTDSTAFNFDSNANVDDGSCEASFRGCTDSTAFNYNESVNTDNGSCVAVIEGCIDSTAYNYNTEANTDNGSCIAIDEVVFGCTNPLGFNYDSLANVLTHCDFLYPIEDINFLNKLKTSYVLVLLMIL